MGGEKRKRSSTIRSAKRLSLTPATPIALPDDDGPRLPELPTSFTKDGPLPTVPARQVDDLPLKDFKSVAESKVLAESLLRSQRKWVDGDIFEKFWTKPLKSRKLDPAELEKNPPKETMTKKLGSCTMVCMPHTFEIYFYGVMEPVKQPPLPPMPAVYQHPQPPIHPPHAQMLPQQTSPPVPAYSSPQSMSRPAGPGHQPAPPPNNVAPRLPAQQSLPVQPPVQQQQQGPVQPNALSGPPNRPPHQPPLQQPPAPPPAPPRPDPVIQMLAIKAASDANLKQLMRIVASGKATTEQLRIFQAHIDSLQPALQQHARQQQMQGSVPAPPLPSPQATPQPQVPTGQAPAAQFTQHPIQPPQPPQYQHPQQYPQPYQQRPMQYAPQVQPQATPGPKSRPFPQAPRQEVVSVVFEFIHPFSQGDRFYFPKHSIIEYSNDGLSLKASFIVTRKLADDVEECYQPITIKLESHTPRALDIFQRVVADPEKTRERMKEQMAKLRRAEETFLVFRLRRDPGEIVPDSAAVQVPAVEQQPLQQRKMQPLLRNASGRFESRHKRDSSTPKADPANTAAPASRPRVKHVKKPLPKAPAQNPAFTALSPTASTSVVKHHEQTPPPQPQAEPQAQPASDSTTTPSSADASAPAAASLPPRQPKPPRSRKGRIADPTKSCHICNTSNTSLWRKADIDGENVTVCNACGIKWKTNAQKQAQIAAAVASGQPVPLELREGRRSSGNSAGGKPDMMALVCAEGGQVRYMYPPAVAVGGTVPPQPQVVQGGVGLQFSPPPSQEPVLQQSATPQPSVVVAAATPATAPAAAPVPSATVSTSGPTTVMPVTTAPAATPTTSPAVTSTLASAAPPVPARVSTAGPVATPAPRAASPTIPAAPPAPPAPPTA